VTTVPAEHGVYPGYPEADYLRHPALSASGAKKLLPPSCPAVFKWERDNVRPEKRAFDFGHAAHAKVLGVGAEVVVVQKTAKDGTRSDADDYRTKSAQEHVEAIRAEGKVPLLAHEVTQVDGMAEALQAHPIARQLLHPGNGRPEVSLFWDDPAHGVPRRCRVDWLREPVDGRLILVDYKTCVSAEPGAIRKVVANYGYHLSAAWYQDVVLGLGLAEDVPFLLVFQEKTAPYVVTVVQLDDESLWVGRRQADQALQVYSECTETGVWPGYVGDDEIPLISLPAWATYDLRNAA
jgi:hypothetical protein